MLLYLRRQVLQFFAATRPADASEKEADELSRPDISRAARSLVGVAFLRPRVSSVRRTATGIVQGKVVQVSTARGSEYAL